MSFWAISLVYKGAATQNVPPAMPVRNLPIMTISTPVAQIIRAQPTVKMRITASMVILRPILSMIEPTGTHIIMHPRGVREAIQLKSVSLILKPRSPFLSSSPVGDVKPRTAPAANAPNVAKIQEIYLVHVHRIIRSDL